MYSEYVVREGSCFLRSLLGIVLVLNFVMMYFIDQCALNNIMALVYMHVS